MCDVRWWSMEAIRLWINAWDMYWNDDLWHWRLPQCDSYTCSVDWCRDLDMILAASRECPFALRMACKVSTHVDLTAGSGVCLPPIRVEWRLGWAVADLGSTVESDLLATDPEAPESRKLFLAWELPISSVLHETGRSSAATADQLEWREHIQEAPPVVPLDIASIHAALGFG